MAVTSSAAQPPMPMSIMNMRFLYRHKLRSVIFCKNASLLQSGEIRSSRIRLPGFGALGRINAAGALFASRMQEKSVLPSVPARETSSVPIASAGLKRYRIGAKS